MNISASTYIAATNVALRPSLRRRLLAAGAGACFAFGAASFASRASAEVPEVKLAIQRSIGYMQLLVMRHDKLIEKHLAKVGLGDTKVTWVAITTGSIGNDSLLAGSLHFAAGGTGPAFILWDKTRNNVDVRGVAALSSMPNLLVTSNPNVKTIRDFTDKDRIAMAGAGSSVQTVYLQMAVAKEYGIENYRKLNKIMVNLPHPDGLNALLSGAGDIDAQFTSPPYQYYALEKPGIHTVLNSYDVMGGPNTFLMVWATAKFREENPKTYRAVVDAMTEATASINADKKRAAEIYVEGEKNEQAAEILKMMNDPQVRYTMAPEGVKKYADFMVEVGTIKNKPSSWKDLFFPEIHQLPGS
jgi:sulfonate transport system substrate-binding protein